MLFGVAVCKQLATLMEGDLTATRTPQNICVLTFSFRAEVVGDLTAAEAQADALHYRQREIVKGTALSSLTCLLTTAF